jgi:hypothetical protein
MTQLLLFFLLSLSAFAQNYDSPATETFVVPISVYAVILIIVGLALNFFGYRLIRTTLFVMGFLLFSFLGFMFLPQLHLSDQVVLLISFCLGLLGGFIGMFLVSFGLFVLGSLAGFSLGLLIISLHPAAFLETSSARAIFLITFITLGILLMYFLQKPAIIISTSMLGSFIFFNGFDVFAHQGFVSQTRAFLKGQIDVSGQSVSANPNLYAVIACVPLLALVGMVVQFLMNRHYERGFAIRTAV